VHPPPALTSPALLSQGERREDNAETGELSLLLSLSGREGLGE